MRTVLDEFITTFRFIKVGDKAVGQSIDALNAKLNQSVALMGRNALLWSAGFVMMGKSAGKLEDQIIGMGNQARTSTGEMWEMNEAIRAIGSNAGVSGGKMRQALDAVVQRTGNIEFAISNAKLLADLIRGGRMDPSSAGDFISAFFTQFEETDPKKIRKVTDELTHMAKLGSLPIAEMGTILPRLFGSMRMSGITDLEQASREVGVLSQVVNAITVKSSRTGTAIENFVLDVSKNIEKVNELTGMTFQGDEGPLQIMMSIIEAVGSGQVKGGMLSDTLGGLQLAGGGNVIKELSEFLGRRGIRAGAAGMSGERLISLLNRDLPEAIGTLDRDTKRYNKTIFSTFARIGNVIGLLKQQIIESDALRWALLMLGDAVEAIAWIFKIMPDWVLKATFALLMFNFVIKNGLIALVWKMSVALAGMIWKFALLNQSVFYAVAGLEYWIAGLLKAAAAQWGLNIAMDANPIGAFLAVIGLVILGITTLVMWLKRWRSMKKMEATLDITKPAGLDNLKASMSNPLGSSVPASRIHQQNARAGNTAIFNINAEGMDADQLASAIDGRVKDSWNSQLNSVYHEIS